MENKLEYKAMFLGLMLTSLGLMMLGFNLLNIIIDRWVLWLFTILSFISAIIYGVFFFFIKIKKPKSL